MAKQNVLYVDNNPLKDYRFQKSVLMTTFATVNIVHSNKDAREALKENDYNNVVYNICMDEPDGAYSQASSFREIQPDIHLVALGYFIPNLPDFFDGTTTDLLSFTNNTVIPKPSSGEQLEEKIIKN